MEVVKLNPAVKDYIWGGDKLFKWGKSSPKPIIAESWELSFHPDGLSLIDGGKYDGQALMDVVSKDDLGKKVNKFPFFPMLVKLIDARDNLSIQVHPSDDYALKNENSYGKTEMWCVLEAMEGAGLYVGFKKDENIEDVEKALKEGTLLEKLNFFEVKKGDVYFIKSGTIHAIGKGVTLIEIQQSSNLTYRLYDYNRVDKNGNPRELHIDKALKVIDLNKYVPKKFSNNILGECQYFTTSKGDSSMRELKATEDSFITFTVIDGRGRVNEMECKKGDTFFIPATKKAEFSGNFSFIYSRV